MILPFYRFSVYSYTQLDKLFFPTYPFLLLNIITFLFDMVKPDASTISIIGLSCSSSKPTFPTDDGLIFIILLLICVNVFLQSRCIQIVLLQFLGQFYKQS